jgi:hypothetical protein
MGLSIYMDWEYFLGIVASLIGLAYYANGRFTKIETSLEWMREALQELKKSNDKRTRKRAVSTTAEGRHQSKTSSGLASVVRKLAQAIDREQPRERIL